MSYCPFVAAAMQPDMNGKRPKLILINFTMKNLAITIFCFLLTIPSLLFADNSKQYWLQELDKSLSQRDQFEQEKHQQIDHLKRQLKQADNQERRYEALHSLFEEYKSYCYDSAVVYARQTQELAEKMGNNDKITESKCAVAFCLISSGLLSEASSILETINPSQLPRELCDLYYEMKCSLYRALADFAHDDPYYTKYISVSNAYLDTLIQSTPPNTIKWYSYKGSRLMRDWKYEEALKAFTKVLESDETDKHQKAMTAAEMAWAYVHMKDDDKAIEYFAQSALYDNESATREITALYHLSRLIYKQGEHGRASRYVHQALEDVQFYNTRLRKVEIGDILPIIEQDRYKAIRSQRNWLIAASCLFVALLLVILYAYWFNRKKNRILTEARETIAGQLEQLRLANTQLLEDDKIKNAYIGRSFYTNSEYIAKLEKLFLTIDRKIAARQYDDVRSMLKLSTLNAERENMYEEFDQTFLKLFPNFVARYNDLFEEKDRKLPPNDHSLTSEMRIFALIRLGINDSERIAKFLDYSVHTVNTYKTRIKNRSTVDNDQFEKMIMKI